MFIDRSTAQRFVRDEDGAIIPLTLVLFLVMVAMVGMGVDIMRHENYRAEAQNALDRGLLAAADLDQTLPAETTVKSYFNSIRHTAGQYTPAVTEDINTAALRQISGSLSASFDTFFMRLAGVPSLTYAADGTAREFHQNIEVSLIIDISGTMRWCENNSKNCPNGKRIDRLVPAAQQFIDKIFAGSDTDHMSVNFIPYAGHVNPGPELFAALGGVRTMHHSGVPYMGSSCMEFEDSDFTYAGLPSTGTYQQVPHFHMYKLNGDDYGMAWGWCPADTVAITPMSNDPQELKDAIGLLQTNLHDGTGTQHGMKWGLALLDPSARSTLETLTKAGNATEPLIAEEDFRGVRPSEYDDVDTRKIIVLMTDGQVSNQQRPDDPLDPQNDYLALNEPSGDRSWRKVKRSTNINRVDAMCDLAKLNGVTIYTIAYMAPNDAIEDMRECATTPSQAHTILGLDIETAFNDIAADINKLKLVP